MSPQTPSPVSLYAFEVVHDGYAQPSNGVQDSQDHDIWGQCPEQSLHPQCQSCCINGKPTSFIELTDNVLPCKGQS